ncbi:MAG: T9SS type A sorting domain-containing protein [Chitinophagales bacterium]|nr:T9SS type A sorting domain-containing protein [Chitinophagales bacterium]
MRHTCIATFVFILLSNAGFAQFQDDVYRQYSDVVVKNGNTIMELPWTGGVNNPHIAMADLNHDGLNDIVVLEDYLSLSTYIATGKGTFRYDFRYEHNFPENITGYIKFMDFNRDNIPDLVHHGNSGVSVSYGYYDKDSLKFRYYKDLGYILNGNWSNVLVSGNSVPGMADIDGDTDIDILSYNWAGEYITYYRNCQVEDGLPKDSIKICIKEVCWGRTRQNFQRAHELGLPPCPQSIFDPITCKGCGIPSHKGTDGINSLCLFDIDSDGDLDYFNGHQGFTDIQFFRNGKSQYGVDSMIAEDTIWGAGGVNMFMPNYPVAFVLDIDHDGDDDLLFTPMDKSTENYKSISFYENTGSNANKNFVYRSSTHLVDRMIDLGIGSYPVFYDFDKDGKKDLFVSSEGFKDQATHKNFSRVFYYRNTSISGKYSFELVSDDFLGLQSQKMEGIALAMGDLDNDSLDDLVIGNGDGTFTFYKNYAASDTVAPVWQLEVSKIKDPITNKDLNVSGNATPCIYDIDNDGKKDLLSGSQFGGIHYYSNFGTTPGTLSLKYVTNKLGDVDPRHINYSYPNTVPYIGPTDDKEIDYLVVGCSWGILYRYDGFQNGAMPAKYTMIDSLYSYIDIGERSAPAFANIDNDSTKLYEMLLGNVLGGLKFYKQDFKVNITDKVAGNKNVVLYPNPAANILNVKWDRSFSDGDVTVQLFSLTGQLIIQQKYDAGGVSCTMNISDVASGTYYCVVRSANDNSVQPVSILK